jgi:hypothetical protein
MKKYGKYAAIAFAVFLVATKPLAVAHIGKAVGHGIATVATSFATAITGMFS